MLSFCLCVVGCLRDGGVEEGARQAAEAQLSDRWARRQLVWQKELRLQGQSGLGSHLTSALTLARLRASVDLSLKREQQELLR